MRIVLWGERTMTMMMRKFRFLSGKKKLKNEGLMVFSEKEKR
jgi:hypothetical protein